MTVSLSTLGFTVNEQGFRAYRSNRPIYFLNGAWLRYGMTFGVWDEYIGGTLDGVYVTASLKDAIVTMRDSGRLVYWLCTEVARSPRYISIYT